MRSSQRPSDFVIISHVMEKYQTAKRLFGNTRCWSNKGMKDSFDLMAGREEWSSCWSFWSRWVHRWSEKSPKPSNSRFLKRARNNVSSLQKRFSSHYLWSLSRHGVNLDRTTKGQRWRKSELGRTARNLPTGTDHLSDHSIPTEITLPGIQTGDHLHTR